MSTFQRIKELSFNYASLAGIGNRRFGGLWASFFALPLLLVGRIFYAISTTFFWWSFLLFTLFTIASVFFALKHISDDFPCSIVIDKVFGILIAFAYIPARFKIMLFGFILFHMIELLRPVLFSNFLGKKIDEIPFGVGVIAGDIASGLICNIFLHMMIWVMN